MSSDKLFPDPLRVSGVSCKVCKNTFRDMRSFEKHFNLCQFACVCPVCGERLSWLLVTDDLDCVIPHSSHIFHKNNDDDFQCLTCGVCFDFQENLDYHTTDDDNKFGCLVCSSKFSSCVDRMQHIWGTDHDVSHDSLLLPTNTDSTDTVVRGNSARTTRASDIDECVSPHKGDASNVSNTLRIPLCELSGHDIQSTGKSVIAAGRPQTEDATWMMEDCRSGLQCPSLHTLCTPTAQISEDKPCPEPQRDLEYTCMICKTTLCDEEFYEKYDNLLQRLCVPPDRGGRVSWELPLADVARSSHSDNRDEVVCPMCVTNLEADLADHTTESVDESSCPVCLSTFCCCIDWTGHCWGLDHDVDVDSHLLPANVDSVSASHVPHILQMLLSESSGYDIQSTGDSTIPTGHPQTEAVRRKRKTDDENVTSTIQNDVEEEEEEENDDDKENNDEKEENDDTTSAAAALSALSLSQPSSAIWSTDFLKCSEAIKTCKQAILLCKKALLDLPISLAGDDANVNKLENIEKRLQRAVERLVPIKKSDGKNEETRVICLDSQIFTASAILQLAREATSQPEALAMRLATWFHEPPKTSTTLLISGESMKEKRRSSDPEDMLRVAAKALSFVEGTITVSVFSVFCSGS